MSLALLKVPGLRVVGIQHVGEIRVLISRSEMATLLRLIVAGSFSNTA